MSPAFAKLLTTLLPVALGLSACSSQPETMPLPAATPAARSGRTQ
ncbi:MAG: hypothetical protein ACOYZ8_16030 [Chloroflexota bacterium]